jgi:hypothetical protein
LFNNFIVGRERLSEGTRRERTELPSFPATGIGSEVVDAGLEVLDAVAHVGNTKEGPAYAVHEMTEERLVVIQT